MLKRLPILILVMLCGCFSRPVAEDLDQNQANQIVALLSRNGISAVAERASGGRARYSVAVPGRKYLPAVSLLSAHNLPGESESSLQELLAQRGLIPNSRAIEALRLDRALALDLEKTLETHPGIAAVRAVVRLHSRDTEAPAVAVVAAVTDEAALSRESLGELISSALPGVRVEHLTLMLAPQPGAGVVQFRGISAKRGADISVPLVPFLVWEVPEGVDLELGVFLMVGIGLMALAGGVIGYVVAFFRLQRGTSALSNAVGEPLRIERMRKELPEL